MDACEGRFQNMKLHSLYLKNFRGYREEMIDFSEGMNVIIGKNDIGKSTIMEALEIFFNGENKGCSSETRGRRL